MEKEHVCPNCGNGLLYDENLESYFCSFCNEYFPNSTFEEVEENEFTGKYMVIDCKMCGKKTIVSKNFTYDVCPFCYNNLIDVVDGVYEFKPKLVAHFKDSKEEFLKKFSQLAKEAEVPDNILSSINLESVKGLFLPFNVYTIENRAECFMQTKESGGRYDADEFYFQRLSYMDESDILVDATKFMPNEVIKTICDFNLKKLDMFFAKYLEEYYTLKPVLTDITSWSELKKVIEDHTKHQIQKYKSKNEVLKEVNVYNQLKNLSKRNVLLPFWVFEFKLDEEQHYLFVNAQTYKMGSDLFFEKKKAKAGLFSKNKDDNWQVRVLRREKAKHIEYRNSLEFMNDLKKFSVNKNDRSAEIRKTR